MKSIAIGNIPRHLYVWVDSKFIHKEPIGFIPAVWFGLNSVAGRVWGIHVLLECGAIFRNLPPQAIAFSKNPQQEVWEAKDAQRWDCYSQNWSAIEYTYLAGLKCKAAINSDLALEGNYLFTVCPLDDGFTAYPQQAKEFKFIQLDNDRLTIQPTNCVLIKEDSFTENPEMIFPKGLKVSEQIWSVESGVSASEISPDRQDLDQ
jgi:hypothetical protein